TNTFLRDNQLRTVEVSWVPGHQNIIGNERADKLAKSAAELASAVGGSRAYIKRINKLRLKRNWVKEWQDKPKRGRFAIANRLPPSLKPTERLTDTKREVFGRLTQCRTGHCFCGEYYDSFVPTETVSCPCGELFQTRDHILRDCPRYDE